MLIKQVITSIDFLKGQILFLNETAIRLLNHNTLHTLTYTSITVNLTTIMFTVKITINNLIKLQTPNSDTKLRSQVNQEFNL